MKFNLWLSHLDINQNRQVYGEFLLLRLNHGKGADLSTVCP